MPLYKFLFKNLEMNKRRKDRDEINKCLVELLFIFFLLN